MGPPIFIGGNRTIREGACVAAACFNGAADFHRRKFLQRRQQPYSPRCASMGPPIFIGGN